VVLAPGTVALPPAPPPAIVAPTDPVSMAFYEGPAITPAQSLRDDGDQDRYSGLPARRKDKGDAQDAQCTR
jgi:hypothetical protein